jgi:hypothetical protein
LPSFGLGGGLPSSKNKIIRESDSFIADPTLLDYWPAEERYTLTEDMYHTESAIQSLKSSLFTNLETIAEAKKPEVALVKPKQGVPSEVISTPKVHRLPDISRKSLFMVKSNYIYSIQCRYYRRK